jgi:hypothetical protein
VRGRLFEIKILPHKNIKYNMKKIISIFISISVLLTPILFASSALAAFNSRDGNGGRGTVSFGNYSGNNHNNDNSNKGSQWNNNQGKQYNDNKGGPKIDNSRKDNKNDRNWGDHRGDKNHNQGNIVTVTNPATLITTTSATINGTNGNTVATDEAFWYGTTAGGPFVSAVGDASSQYPSGWVGITATTKNLAANGTFSLPVSTLTPNTTYNFVAWSLVGGTWYPGSVLSFTTLVTDQSSLPGTLAAQDFGVVNYDSGGNGILKGYTAGFGLTDATFAGAQSVVVKLYAAGDVLLQTNTAILPKFNADITGVQVSSPFDVSGTFNYVTDGYWTNVKETQYGQGVPAVKVVATVTLANGKIVTATNTTMSGDPTTIYSTSAVTNPATLITTTSATINGTNGNTVATDEAFWYGTTAGGPFVSAVGDASSQYPSGWVGITATTKNLAANGTFSLPVSTLTPNTTYNFVAWSLVGGTWYPGSVLSFTTLQ